MYTCKHCKKEYPQSALKDQCNSCYLSLRRYGCLAKDRKKICKSCEKEYLCYGRPSYCIDCSENPKRKCKHCKKEYNTGTSKNECHPCKTLIQKYGTTTPEKWKKNCHVCESPFVSKGTRKYCDKCRYELKLKRNLSKYRKKKGISLDLPKKKKKKNGEGSLSPNGYRYITKVGHPNSRAHGRIAEHTYVMSNIIGRPLNKGESVHHKNGIKDDNSPDNLELWSRCQPPGQRVEDKIKWCREFLEEYGYKISD